MRALEEVAMTETRRPLMCRMGFHRWLSFTRSDNSRFRLCERCGRETTHSKDTKAGGPIRPDDLSVDPRSFR